MYSISVKNGNSFIEIQNEKKKVKDPILYEALNSCGSLTFEAQIEDDIYDGYERLKSKVLVKEDGAIQFVGRLLRTTIDFQNTKKPVSIPLSIIPSVSMKQIFQNKKHINY